MKNAIILHGTGGTPKSYWFPNIKQFLEKKGYDVWIPQLPTPNHPDLKIQLPFLLESDKINGGTILIGHSAGCPLILSILENIDFKINKAILVSGFYTPLDNDPEPIVQEKYDWKKIKKNCKEFIFINSDDDPWGCNQKQAQGMFDNLGGTMILRHGEGHMGSDHYNQPYNKFPLLEKIIEL